jgi:DNA-binding NtrC family response regulator
MDHSISLIKALVNTLKLEVETLDERWDEDLGGSIDLAEKVREYESTLIKSALAKTGGNQRQAAALLNIKTSTLNTKIKHLGIRLFKQDRNDAEANLPFQEDPAIVGSNVERFRARG